MSNFMWAGTQELPVGYIFEFDPTGITGAPDLSTPEKVRAYFGYGTWERYGTDRVTVGAGAEYAVGNTGGEKTHTLSVSEIPNHSHPVFWQPSENGDTSGNHWYICVDKTAEDGWLYNMRSTGNAGGDQPHNNMQPYIAPYRYRRIA